LVIDSYWLNNTFLRKVRIFDRRVYSIFRGFSFQNMSTIYEKDVKGRI